MILSEKEFTYLLALRSAPHVGNVISRRLIEYFGSAEKLFNLSARDLRQVKGIGTQLSSWLHDRTALVARAKEELERMRDSDIRGIHYYEDRYPLRLRSCFDAPLILFYRGDLDCLQGPSVGVVGTRNATPYGVRQTEELLAGLVDLKPTVLSGLAYGIDIAAHRSALQHTNGGGSGSWTGQDLSKRSYSGSRNAAGTRRSGDVGVYHGHPARPNEFSKSKQDHRRIV